MFRNPLYLVIACLIVSYACRSHGGDVVPILVCELRAPKTLNPDPKTRVSLASASEETRHFLSAGNQKEPKADGEFLVFQPQSFLVHAEHESRRAIIVEKFPTPAQVFRLSLPKKPTAIDWTEWRRPDFMATGDVGWAVIYNKKVQGLSTNIPSECFELRYKIEMQDLGATSTGTQQKKSDS